jgi:hypothetical protein
MPVITGMNVCAYVEKKSRWGQVKKGRLEYTVSAYLCKK